MTTDVWNGGTSSNWSTTSNWSLGALPTSSNDVSISSSETNAADMSNLSPFTVNSLTIGGGLYMHEDTGSNKAHTGITVSSGGSLIVDTNFHEGGTNLSADNAGAIFTNHGTIYLGNIEMGVDSILKGAGGFFNDGTIDMTGDDTSGSNFTAKLDSGTGNLTNDGAITVNDGSTQIKGNIVTDSGHTGSITMDLAAHLKMDGADSGQTVFMDGDGSVSALNLNTPSSFAGTLSGFKVTNDTIHVTGFAYSGTTETWSSTGVGEADILLSDATHSVSLHLTDTSTQSHFSYSAAADGAVKIKFT